MVFTVVAVSASPNCAVTFAPTATFVAPRAGVTPLIVGGVVSGAAAPVSKTTSTQ